jgi:hypothetical protein
MEPRQPGKLELLLATLSTAVMAWCMLPEHQQRLLMMRALASLHKLAGRAARLQGLAGMGDELAGLAQARQYYSAAYQLSRARDALGRQLERMRP